jgi:hypothetical protein
MDEGRRVVPLSSCSSSSLSAFASNLSLLLACPSSSTSLHLNAMPNEQGQPHTALGHSFSDTSLDKELAT